MTSENERSGKTLRFFTAVFIITISLLCFRMPAYAISQNEADASEALTLNSASTGTLTDTVTEKWYRFDITQPGYFRVQFKSNANANSDDIDAGWHFQIYKKNFLPAFSYI